MNSPNVKMLALAGVIIAATAASPATATDVVNVITDRAKVFRIDEPADTVILGNPSIADVTLHDRTTLVITGKSYGSTNLVILNAAGEPVIDEIIVVGAPDNGVVTVQRSTQRFSYNCSPTCEPTRTMGDNRDFYKTNSEQAANRSSLASGAGAPQN